MNLNLLNDSGPNSLADFFNIHSWFTGIAVIFMILSVIIIGITVWKKGKKIALIPAFILGIIGIGIFTTILSTNTTISTDIVAESKDWLSSIGSLFVSLMSMAIPFYIFSIIIIFIIGENQSKVKGKTYLASFSSLLSLSLLGIAVALLMVPIIILIPNTWFSVPTKGILSGTILSGILKKGTIIWTIMIAIIVGFAIKLVIKEKSGSKEGIIKTVTIFKDIIFKYIEIIIYLVPFAIATQLTIIGLTNITETGNKLYLMGTYMGIFWLGAIIITSILIASNIFISSSDKTKKEKLNILVSHGLYVFGAQSTVAALSATQKVARDLGVSEEISTLTPTKGTIMGMVMCNGFTPMIITLMSLSNYGHLSTLNILIAIVMIFILAVSSSGAGSTDYTITFATLGTLGVGTGFYLNTIMPVQEINETLIARTNNVYGHLLATQITEKVHLKYGSK